MTPFLFLIAIDFANDLAEINKMTGQIYVHSKMYVENKFIFFSICNKFGQIQSILTNRNLVELGFYVVPYRTRTYLPEFEKRLKLFGTQNSPQIVKQHFVCFHLCPLRSMHILTLFALSLFLLVKSVSPYFENTRSDGIEVP